MGFDADTFLSVLLEFALRAVEDGELTFDDPGSTILFRRVLEVPSFGFVLGAGEDDESEDGYSALPGAIKQVLIEELGTHGLSQSSKIEEHVIGKGADDLVYVVTVSAGLVGLWNVFSNLKKVDESVGVLRKWIRAVRACAIRLGAGGQYTADFLKAICVEDAIGKLGSSDVIDPSLITATVAKAETEFEAVAAQGHFTVTVPIPRHNKAFIYVISSAGDIFDCATLKYPTDESESASREVAEEGQA